MWYKIIFYDYKLDNKKKIKQILLKIIETNILIQDYSFSFLLKSEIKNICVFWGVKNINLHLNISLICKPDEVSLDIIETYLNSN